MTGKHYKASLKGYSGYLGPTFGTPEEAGKFAIEDIVLKLGVPREDIQIVELED